MILQPLYRFLYTLEAPRRGGRPFQAGALCWRRQGKELTFLLVTSRRSGKWGIPKGWGLIGRPLHRTATREAWEEAGVVGQAENRLLGVVGAAKHYRLAGEIHWQLAVYPLEVERLADEWPERGQRQRGWFTRGEAAERIRPKGLAPLVAAFAP